MKRPKLTSSPTLEQSYVEDSNDQIVPQETDNGDAENTGTNSTTSTEAPVIVSDSIGPATMEYIVSRTYLI